MQVRTAFVSVAEALLSRTVLRNLVLLAAMTGVLATVPFRSVWASEIVLNFPCHNIEYTPANTSGVGASCRGDSLCYSAARNSLSLINT